jgi:uncharacterized membrane protein
MKKMIPVFSPIIIGLFGGLFVECVLCVLSVVISPFADSEQIPTLNFLVLTALLSILFIAPMVIANIAYLINLNNAKRAKRIAILEALSALVLFLVSWSLWEAILDNMLKWLSA